jgi:hypothetical protein
MKGWKRFSLFHLIQDRRERKFHKDTIVDFFSFLSKNEDYHQALNLTCFVAGVVTMSYFGWAWWTLFIVHVGLYASLTVPLAALDTYNQYKYRLRQRTIKSIERILGISNGRR